MTEFSSLQEIASYFDHTNLKPFATSKDIQKLCEEAVKWGFKSVCVNPVYTSFVKEQLKKSKVKACTVIGFPLGASDTQSKVFEAKRAFEQGAEELDVVLAIGKLKEGDENYISEELRAIREAVPRAILKLILETCYLTDSEIKRACELAVQAGFDFVKTSTGFGSAGATVEHVKLMNQAVKNKVLVKASGGIRTFHDFKRMIEAGASRIGASSSVKILEEAKALGYK